MVELYNYHGFYHPILGMFLNVIIQILSFRYICKKTIIASMIIGYLTGLLAIIYFEISTIVVLKYPPIESFFLGSTVILTYILLSFCYINFLGLIISALRTRILTEINNTKGISMKECMERYSPEEMLINRSKRWINKNQIYYKDNCYYLNKNSIFYISKFIIYIRSVIIRTPKTPT
jgi:hypothetical protein